MPTRKLRAWAAEEAGIPDWLFEECYHAVGDLAETIALLLPDARARRATCRCATGSRSGCCRCAGRTRTAQRAAMLDAWRELDRPQRFVWNKLITGGFRVGRLAAARDAGPGRGRAGSTPASSPTG